MNVKYCRNTEARHQLWTREMGIIYDRERGFFDALQWNEEAKAMRDVKKKKKRGVERMRTLYQPRPNVAVQMIPKEKVSPIRGKKIERRRNTTLALHAKFRGSSAVPSFARVPASYQFCVGLAKLESYQLGYNAATPGKVEMCAAFSIAPLSVGRCSCTNRTV